MGLFGVWIPLAFQSMPPSSASTVPLTEIRTLDASSDVYRDQAIKAKANKDYQTAGDMFSKTASVLIGQGSHFNKIEAAMAFEDASKCYQQLGNFSTILNMVVGLLILFSGQVISVLQQAADLFQRHDRNGVRAARVLEHLANIYERNMKDPSQALHHVIQAADAYERDNDPRAAPLRVRAMDLMASEGRFSDAMALCDANILNASHMHDTTLKYRIKDILLAYGLCILGTQDWVKLTQWIDTVPETHAEFLETREYKLLRDIDMAISEFNALEVERIVSDYLRVMPFSERWKMDVLKKAQQSLDKDELT